MNKHWVTLKQSNYAELCNKLWEKKENKLKQDPVPILKVRG